MAQPNLVREPSMDEILASIRKIIESNEPGMPGFPANDLGHAPDDDDRTDRMYDEESADDIHLTIDDAALVAEFEAEVVQQVATPSQERTFQPQPQPQPEAVRPAVSAAAPPQSLADVAARVRAASERHSIPLREQEGNGNAAGRTESPLVTARMAPSVATPAATAPVRQPAATGAEERDRTGAGASGSEQTVRNQQVSVVSEKEVATLVSPAVGEQVARSFGDLALAIDSSARRSFDEIAEDMLRPMLQEWLDDNLPTLVERLVREEIERVARGPRR